MKKGFTLVEILVVAVIIAIISVVAIPAYNSYIIRASNQLCEYTASTVLSCIISFAQVKGDIDPLAGGDVDALNAILGSGYEVSIPEGYEALITITNKETIEVYVFNTMYMGAATIGT